MHTVHWNHLSLFALLQTSIPDLCSPALPPCFLWKRSGITLAAYNQKKEGTTLIFHWFLLFPSLCWWGMCHTAGLFFVCVFLQVQLLLSNIQTDVLSVIPLVGYGETACKINRPTLKQEIRHELTQSSVCQRWEVIHALPRCCLYSPGWGISWMKHLAG